MTKEEKEKENVFEIFHELRKPKQKLPIQLEEFLANLEKTFKTSFYYFGSIQRNDFIPHLSDIDIDIFPKEKSPKEFAMLLANYLHLSFVKIKKIEWILPMTQTKTVGYKIKYHFQPQENDGGGEFIEFSIYPLLSKPYVLYHHAQKLILPWWISWCLILLKYLFYKYHLIPSDVFFTTKRFLMSTCIGIEPDVFQITKAESVKHFLSL